LLFRKSALIVSIALTGSWQLLCLSEHPTDTSLHIPSLFFRRLRRARGISIAFSTSVWHVLLRKHLERQVFKLQCFNLLHLASEEIKPIARRAPHFGFSRVL